MDHDATIARIWENLETLQGWMTSIEAEGLSPEQLEFVDSRLSAILEETGRWFAVQDEKQ